MAYRDKSQGFAFVYVDIHKLLASQKSGKPFSSPPEATPPKPNVVNLNRDPKVTKKTDDAVEAFLPVQPELQPKSLEDVKSRGEAIQQIKSNLDRMQSLHHKLHTVLDDLNRVSHWKKKKKK